MSAALLGLAAAHAGWASGWRWPGGSDHELAETVVGPGADLPPASAMWAVAGALGVAAGLVTAAGPGAGPVARSGVSAVAAVLLLRGTVGPVVDLAQGADARYHRLDLLIYSPLCLALGAGAAALARRAR